MHISACRRSHLPFACLDCTWQWTASAFKGLTPSMFAGIAALLAPPIEGSRGAVARREAFISRHASV